MIGFQRREIHGRGTDYGWHEYVLFNPQGDFAISVRRRARNDIAVLDEMPAARASG